MEKLQKEREKRNKAKGPSGEQDSTSLSASAVDRSKSVSEVNRQFSNNTAGFRGFFVRLCTRMCMDVDVAEED